MTALTEHYYIGAKGDRRNCIRLEMKFLMVEKQSTFTKIFEKNNDISARGIGGCSTLIHREKLDFFQG
jgi:hypothetical protein